MADFCTRFATYYQQSFPQRDALHVTNCIPMTHGLASDVVSLDVTYTGDGTTYHTPLIVKQYASGDAPARAAATAAREFHTLRHLAAAGYPVPDVLLLEPDLAPLGSPFIVMARIDGAVLWDVIHAQPDRASDLTTRFCRLFVDLHALDWQPFAPDPAPFQRSDPYACVNREIAALRDLVAAGERAEFSPVIDWLARTKSPDIACTRPSLIHRDYHPWNVILTPADRCVVIDWDSEVSDFRFDLAWTIQLMDRAGFTDFAQQVHTLYADMRGSPIPALPYFEVAATVRWALIVLRSLDTGAALRADARAQFRQFLEPMLARACTLIQTHTGIALAISL